MFKIKYCHLISCTFIQDLLTPQVTVRPTLTNIHGSVILRNANCLHNNDMTLFVVPFFSSSSLNYEHKNVPSDSEPPVPSGAHLIGNSFIFHHNNDPKHTFNAVKAHLDSAPVRVFFWPP